MNETFGFVLFSEEMFEHLQNRFAFPKETWGKYRKNFTRLEVPAKTILLKENEISLNAYFIEK